MKEMEEMERRGNVDWHPHLDEHRPTRPIRRISLKVNGFDGGSSIEYRVRERDGREEGRREKDLAGGG